MQKNPDNPPERRSLLADHMREHVQKKYTNRIHCHPYSELLVIEHGDVAYTTGGKVLQLGDRSVIYNRAGQIYNHFVKYERIYERYKIKFYEEDLPIPAEAADQVAALLARPYAKRIGEGDFEIINGHARRCCELLGSGRDPMRCAMALLELTLALVKGAKAKRANDEKDDGYVAEVASFIGDHLDERLTIENIAERFFVSRSKLIYDFKAYSRLGVSEYITLGRVERAKELLVLGHSVSSVAKDCGFSSPSYFIKVFSSIVGITPLQFQLKNNRK